jgi:HSP20 family protein
VSLSETQDEYVYQIDLAGVRKDDVRVSVIAGGIDVSGSRQAGLNLGAQRALASERPMGTFRRALPLPVDIAVNGLSAQLSDGVLSIRVPRARATQGAVRGVPIS